LCPPRKVDPLTGKKTQRREEEEEEEEEEEKVRGRRRKNGRKTDRNKERQTERPTFSSRARRGCVEKKTAEERHDGAPALFLV
jgi:hypothetical protein